MSKRRTTNKLPKPLKPATFRGAGEYTCSECGAQFDYSLSEAERGKLLSVIGGSVPIRVTCPSCGGRPVIHGVGKAGKRIKREDWDESTMGSRPWEDNPRPSR